MLWIDRSWNRIRSYLNWFWNFSSWQNCHQIWRGEKPCHYNNNFIFGNLSTSYYKLSCYANCMGWSSRVFRHPGTNLNSNLNPRLLSCMYFKKLSIWLHFNLHGTMAENANQQNTSSSFVSGKFESNSWLICRIWTSIGDSVTHPGDGLVVIWYCCNYPSHRCIAGTVTRYRNSANLCKTWICKSTRWKLQTHSTTAPSHDSRNNLEIHSTRVLWSCCKSEP